MTITMVAPPKGSGAFSTGEADPAVLADHQLQQILLPDRALLGAVGNERQPFGTGGPVHEVVKIWSEPRCAAVALPANRPGDRLDRTFRIVRGCKELDQGLLGGGLRLGQEVQVPKLAFGRGDRVVFGHPAKLGDHVGTAAPAVFDDGPHLLVAEPDVGAVAAAVVDVVHHVRRQGARRDMDEQATPARPGGVGDLMAAHRQRRSNLVTGNLVDTISESGTRAPVLRDCEITVPAG
jgi:hypothetical protein